MAVESEASSSRRGSQNDDRTWRWRSRHKKLATCAAVAHSSFDCERVKRFSFLTIDNAQYHHSTEMKVDMKDKASLDAISRKRTMERFPKLQSSDELSVDSTASAKWSQPYEPPPLVDRSTVLLAGVILFALAMIWPPLILFVAYMCSKIIPYSFRVNDDPATRRRLFAEFKGQDDLPNRFKLPSSDIEIQHGYWTNRR
jgi:hypothetical protein